MIESATSSVLGSGNGWPGEKWLDVREIQIDIDAVVDFALPRDPKHLLRAKIILKRKALLFGASRGLQVIDRLLINWKISHGRAVLG